MQFDLVNPTLDSGVAGGVGNRELLVDEQRTGLEPAHIASLQAEILELRAQVDQLRAQNGKSVERQDRLMELLGTTRPEHLVHDLRNLLNERNLLRALADAQV